MNMRSVQRNPIRFCRREPGERMNATMTVRWECSCGEGEKQLYGIFCGARRKCSSTVLLSYCIS
jgi:hypothetical protein